MTERLQMAERKQNGSCIRRKLQYNESSMLSACGGDIGIEGRHPAGVCFYSSAGVGIKFAILLFSDNLRVPGEYEYNFLKYLSPKPTTFSKLRVPSAIRGSVQVYLLYNILTLQIALETVHSDLELVCGENMNSA